MINNDAQHMACLAEVERLAVMDPDPESKEGQLLELLARLVEDYETSRFTMKGHVPSKSGYVGSPREE